MYSTILAPTGKKSPGEAVEEKMKAAPGGSVQEGGVQNNTAPVVPSSTTSTIGPGKSAQTGGVVSTVNQR